MKRFDAFYEDGFVEAMIIMIKATNKSKYFRWFDSGDLQGEDMLSDINVIAWASPNIQFWLPTKEYKLIKDFKDDVAPNLVIRVSAPMIDKDYKGHTHYSTVYTKDNLHMAKGYVCPASKQGNICGSCRACWSNKISEVSYVAH